MCSQKKEILTHVKIIGLFLSQVTNGYTQPLATETPKDGVIIDGAGSIHYSNDNTLTIKQNSPSMVSEWKSFNIGENSTVNIEQPQANSKLLNRINDANPTEIHGKLNSNGQVYLLNQQGIIFGKTAKVDVGGIVASSQDLTNENFKADKNEFANKTGTLSEINNEGSINAKDGMVALIAPRVSNSRNITSKNGDVALVSGDKVNIDFRGDGLISVNVDKSTLNAVVENKGLIQAENGNVILNAKSANQLLSSVVNNQGIIEAHSLKNVGGQIILDGDDSNQTQLSGTLDVSSNTGKAGKITVTGHEIILEDNAYLNANGQEGGGDVLIGGDWQGQGNLPQATKVTMQTKAKIDANAIENGHGGKVVLWSDVKNTESTTEIHGEISAKGGAKSGDGGKIETSGHKFDVNDIKINASAPKGKNGEWLIDPVDITIDSTLSAPNTILTSTINNTLNSGTDFTVSTTAQGNAQVGDINIKSNIFKFIGAGATTLRLMANHDIILSKNTLIIGATSALNVVLHAGINSTEGLVLLDDGSHIYTNGGDIVIGGQSDPLKDPALGHNGLAGITLGTSAHIGAGMENNIILYGKGAAGSPGILLKDNSIINGINISLKGIGGDGVVAGTGGDGIKLQDNVKILSKNNITETGQGGNGATGGNGISLNNNNLITAKNQIDFTNTSGTGGVDFYVSPTKLNTIGYYPNDTTYNSSHISFKNDTMNLADIKVQSLQDLIIQPRTANTTIGIGGAGTLQIPYQKLLSGFPSLIIGSPTSGNINISGTANFTNSVVMISGGDITIANGSSIATNQANGYLALSAGGNFINYAGPNALTTTDAGANDRWIVYSNNPKTTVFDGLGLPNSSQALFAPTPPANILTNSYVFATGTNITASATYEDLSTLNYNGVAAQNLLTPATLNALKSIGTLNTGNYPIGIASSLGSLVITPASLTVSAIAQSKLYGDADPLLTYTASGFKGGDTVGVLSGGLSRAGGENVGTYSIASSLANANYTINYTPENFKITPAPLAISATAQSKIYGDTDPLLTYTASGFKGGDTVGVLSGSLSRASGENVGTYSIASSLANANYTINYTPENFKITPASLAISATAQSKLYGDTDPLLTYTASGFKGGDTVGVLSGGLSRASGENVGAYSIASSLANVNYAINYTPANFDITPASLTISANAKSKIYGDADPLLTYTASGFKGNDTTASLSGGLSRANGENVGTYSIASSLANANYAINYTPANFDITPASLTISANAKSKIYGDADPLLTYTASGFKGNDTTTVLSGGLSRTNGEDVGTYSIASSLVNSNYAINYTPANFDITPASLAISATAQSKLYGDADPLLTYTASGFKRSDTTKDLTGGLSRADGENVGTYSITSSLVNSNYVISYTPANFDINPIILNGSLVGKVNKPFDGTDVATLLSSNYHITGFINDDNVLIINSSAVFENSSIGKNKKITANFLPSDFIPLNNTLLNNYTLPTSIVGNIGEITQNSKIASQSFECSTVNPSMLLGSVTVNKTDIDIDSINNQGFIIGSATISIANNGVLTVTNAINNYDVSQLEFIDFQGTESPSNLAISQKNEKSIVENNQKNDTNNTNLISALAKKGTPNSPLINSIKSQEKQNTKKQQENYSLSNSISNDFLSNPSSSIYGIDRLENKLTQLASQKNIPSETAKIASHSFISVLTQNLAKGVLMRESLKLAEQSFNEFITNQALPTSTSKFKDFLTNAKNENKLMYQHDANESNDVNTWKSIVNNQLAKGQSIEQAFENANSAMAFELSKPNRDVNEKIKKLEKKSSVFDQILGQLLIEKIPLDKSIESANTLYNQVTQPIMNKEAKLVEDISIMNNNSNNIFKQKDFDKSFQSLMVQGTPVVKAIEILSKDNKDLSQNNTPYSDKPKNQLATGKLNDFLIDPSVDKTLNAMIKRDYALLSDINTLKFKLTEEKFNTTKGIHSILATGKNIDSMINDEVQNHPFNHALNNTLTKGISIDNSISLALGTEHKNIFVTHLPLAYSHELKQLIANHKNSFPAWINYESTSDRLIIHDIPKNVHLPFSIILSNKYTIEITKYGFQFK